jgi:hypothetical protein
MDGWIKFRRTDGQATDTRFLIILRPSTIAFNAQFVRANGLDEKTRVTVHCNSAQFRLGFQFHSDVSDQDSYALTRDGGQGGRNAYGRSIGAAALMSRYRWLSAAASLPDRSVRRYSPEWLPAEGLWRVNIRPSFEIRVPAARDIEPGICGIYRYIDTKDGKTRIVYIGKGDIRARANSPGREAWEFDIIEYSVIADVTEQEKWETQWLDDYRNEFGTLPFYNRVGGKVAT